MLPALKELCLWEPAAGPDGVQRLAEKLGAADVSVPRLAGFSLIT